MNLNLGLHIHCIKHKTVIRPSTMSCILLFNNYELSSEIDTHLVIRLQRTTYLAAAVALKEQSPLQLNIAQPPT